MSDFYEMEVSVHEFYFNTPIHFNQVAHPATLFW